MPERRLITADTTLKEDPVMRYLLVGLLAVTGVNPTSSQEADWIEPQVTHVDASFRGMAVRSPEEAWVSGSKGTVIRTVDAGKSWTRIHIAESNELDFRDIALPEPNTVVLMSAGAGDKSRIFRSTDSGSTWTVTLANRDEAGFFNAIAFFDKHNGMLIGDPIDGRLDIYSTTDGGVTWLREQGPPMEQGEYGFAASGTNIATNGPDQVWIATGGSIARVLRGSNRGRDWSLNKTPITQGNESSGIFSIAFRDSHHGIVVGGDYKNPQLDHGNVARTSDGGATWSLVNPRGRIPHKACVRHIAGKSWMTVGRTGVAVSRDDGVSWDHVSDQSYYTFDIDSKTGIGWMAGSEGRVARFTFPRD
jgi:photosystem II stability/assembly factor-like uncharacterized protein